MTTPAFTAPFQVGMLVKARGREWVVLPSEDPEILIVRPLTGSEHEVCGIYRPLEGEQVEAASFPPPNPNHAGDFIAGRLLRDAVRLSLRNSAVPLRSLGAISVRPKPYQLVPLIMALRLDPVRLLIADDVGVGKTIEAGLAAKELLERGEARRLCVICPPHLCDQWYRELREKFHIPAVVVRTNTLARLERDLPRRDRSVYEYYPYLVVSIDFVKRDRRRDEFLAHCPDLVIVDEVHTAAQPGGHASGEQQLRHELVRRVAEQSDRHLLLLTATPHSGVEESFRSLLGLLKPEFAHLPLDRLTDTHRARLARHYVQRLRADVSRWMDTETRFPTRDPQEESYELSPQYAALFEDLLAFTREIVAVPGLSQPRQRVRYWAALALLRCVMSSPAAAVEALLGRAKAAAEEAEEEFREWQVLDPIREEGTNDTVPDSAVSSGEYDLSGPERRRLREFARRAHEIADRGADTKIAKAMEIVGPLLQQGYSPIIYCRFIETAKYVRDQLEQRLRDRFPDVHVVAVTSETGDDEEREARVAELAKSPVRVLVATDCLSEGVNLQEHFNAVLHYDLPWNPNRLEQREGRVDRFGQVTPVIPAVLLYGKDNRIDLIVLDVLIRKAHQIFRATGVRVPVPVDSESVMKALAQALFEGRAIRHEQIRLDLEEVQTVEQFHRRWERDAEHEKVSRSRFAQHAIRPDEVAAELQAADRAVGDPEAAQRFLQDAAQRLQLPMEWKNGHAVVAPAGPLAPLADRLGWRKPQRVVFESPPPTGLQGAEVVSRNHPLVVWTADRIINAAFAPTPDRRFARCGAAYTAAVKRRTTLLLLRIRYRLTGARGRELFGEEVVTTAFRPTGNGPEWLDPDSGEVLALLQARPIGSVAQDERVRQVEWALRIVDGHRRDLRTIAQRRAEELEAAHERLRQQTGGRRLRVEPYEPDVLGVYVLLPGGQR